MSGWTGTNECAVRWTGCRKAAPSPHCDCIKACYCTAGWQRRGSAGGLVISSLAVFDGSLLRRHISCQRVAGRFNATTRERRSSETARNGARGCIDNGFTMAALSEVNARLLLHLTRPATRQRLEALVRLYCWHGCDPQLSTAMSKSSAGSEVPE